MRKGGRDVLCLIGDEVEAGDRGAERAAEQNVRVERVGCNVLALAARAHRPPIALADGGEVAEASRACGSGILLRSANPVRETVDGHDVVELRRGLVVPGAPCRGAVETDDGALVGPENHARRIVGRDPQAVVVVAPRRAFDGVEGLSPVPRAVERSIADVNRVGVFGINRHTAEIPSAFPDSIFRVHSPPVHARIVGAIEPALFGIHDQVNAIGIRRRNRDTDPSQSFRWQTVAGNLFPMIASVARFVKAAARPRRGRVDAPRRAAGLPERGVNDLRIVRVEGEINSSGVFVFEKDALPHFAAIG